MFNKNTFTTLCAYDRISSSSEPYARILLGAGGEGGSKQGRKMCRISFWRFRRSRRSYDAVISSGGGDAGSSSTWFTISSDSSQNSTDTSSVSVFNTKGVASMVDGRLAIIADNGRWSGACGVFIDTFWTAVVLRFRIIEWADFSGNAKTALRSSASVSSHVRSPDLEVWCIDWLLSSATETRFRFALAGSGADSMLVQSLIWSGWRVAITRWVSMLDAFRTTNTTGLGKIG